MSKVSVLKTSRHPAQSLFFLAISILALLCADARAQLVEPRLVISIQAGQTVFHLGERIPLLMSFTGPQDGSYSMGMRAYDRSGRLTLDSFTVEPAAGARDPLAKYFAFNSGMMGGAGGNVVLAQTPVIRSESLNEWIRFDEPGVYLVTVISHRAGKTKAGHFGFGTDYKLESNHLQLRIIDSTPEWQKATLDRVERELSKPWHEGMDYSPERQQAMEDLRYLASPAAIDVLTANLRDDRQEYSPAAFFGIVALKASQREATLKHMGLLLADPTFPISLSFLEAMAQLQMRDVPVPAAYDKRKSDAYQAELRPMQQSCWDQAAASLSHKSGTAQIETARTLLSQAQIQPTPAVAAEIARVLDGAFSELPSDVQANLLIDQWDTIRSHDLLPTLRKLATVTAGNEAQAGVVEFSFFGGLRADALRRWYELELEAAKREAIRQIGSESPLLDASEVDFLPPMALPQYEGIWTKAFAESQDSMRSDRLGSLLIHFGTGASSLKMVSLATAEGNGSCNAQVDALAYVVRFDPEAARPILTQAALHSDRGTLCYGAPLNSLSKYWQSPVLLEAAVAALGNPNANVVDDALMYIRKFGDVTARQPVLDRYLQWSKRGQDAGKSEPQLAEGDKAPQQERELGSNLAHTLLASQGWVADGKLIQTALQHCVGQPMCTEVQDLTNAALEVSAYRDPSGATYRIGEVEMASQELFEARLDMYPKGTSFTVSHSNTGYAGEQRKIETSLPLLLATHGMKVQNAGD